MVATGCGHNAGSRDFSGQQVGERTPRLERAGMLEKLKFEAQASSSQPEIRRIDLYDWSPPNVRSDEPLRLDDRVSINHVVGLDVHARLPEPLDYTNCPRRGWL